MNDPLPVGPAVPQFSTVPPKHKTIKGRFVQLRPIEPVRDAESLYAVSHGSPDIEALWTYLPYGPFPSKIEMQAWLTVQAEKTDPLFFAVIEQDSGLPVGMTSYLNVVPEMRRFEIGHIWYGTRVQRTKINTETIYMMLRDAFDVLGYRRAEWKCDNFNERSKSAALRLGFKFEGLFNQHLLYKGRNRDTAWFAMMDHEWPRIKKNMETWLYSDHSGISLGALNN